MVSFRKSISLGKGLRLNLNKRGIGVSAGIPGFRVGVNSRGAYTTSSIPGTGIHSQKYISAGTGGKASRLGSSSPAASSGIATHSLPVGAGLLTVPPELCAGRVGWGWAVFLGLLGFAWAPLFVGAGILGVFAIATSVSPKAKAAQAVRNGLTAIQTGNWPLAVENLMAAHQAYPDLPHVTALLGLALAGADRSKEAEAHLEAAYTAVADPAMGPLLAAVTLDNDKPGRAIDILQGLPQDMARLPAVVNLLGQAFLRLGRFEAAAEALKQGPVRKRDMTPEKLECHYLLGRAYLGCGERAKARREFERVIASDVDYRDVQSLLAEAGRKRPAGGVERKPEDQPPSGRQRA